LTPGDFGAVYPGPVCEGDGPDATMGEKGAESPAVGLGAGGESADIGEERLGRLLAVRLVGADDTAGAPFDPPGGVEAGHRGALAGDTAEIIGNTALLVVEGYAGDGDTAVTDAAEEDAA